MKQEASNSKIDDFDDDDDLDEDYRLLKKMRKVSIFVLFQKKLKKSSRSNVKH